MAVVAGNRSNERKPKMNKEQIAKFEEYINRQSKANAEKGDDLSMGMFAGAVAALSIIGYKAEMVGGEWKVVSK